MPSWLDMGSTASFILLCVDSLLLQLTGADTLLFHGAQEEVFPDAPAACLAAFDTPLRCDEKFREIIQQMTDAGLSVLCTPSCESSLQDLKAAVSFACGDYDILLNGHRLSAVQSVDLVFYNYNMSCLVDSSGDFCLTVEESWDVHSLNASGQAI